jgi:hypothetical protein
MATFKQVDPNEIENSREGTRGRVSYPIIKGFMETGFYMAEVSLEGSRKPTLMLMLLKSYCVNHDMPVKPLIRKGRLYLMRLDVDKDGNAIPNWLEQAFPMDALDKEVTLGAPIDEDLNKLA